MNTPAAIEGWLWIKHGFELFRKRPFEIMLMFLVMLFCYIVMSAIPIVAPIALTLLIPVLSMGFMTACRNIEEGQLIPISVLFAHFRSPALRSLVLLGLVQFGAMICSFFLTMEFDGGFLWDLATKRVVIDEKTLKESGMAVRFFTSIALTRLFYLPALMAFWYAPALIAWHGMGVRKSLFYSFFAVWRSRAAFIVYFLAWLTLLFLISFLLGGLASFGGMAASIINMFLIPIAMLCLLVLQISFYSSYKDVFPRVNSA